MRVASRQVMIGPTSPPQNVQSTLDDGPRKTFLVADDTTMVRVLLQKVLRSSGFLPRAASDGRAAMDIVEQQTIDAIVTDLEMPFLTGSELIRKIRMNSNPEIRRLPVIVVSSMRDPAGFSQLRALGVTAILGKPVDTKQFESVAKQLFLKPAES